MDSIPSQLLLQIILILLNAFFAATEIAVLSLNKTQLEKKAEGGEKTAKRLLILLQEPSGFLSTIQIGITLAGFLGSAFAADNFSEYLVQWVSQDLGITSIPLNVLDTLSVIIITIIIVTAVSNGANLTDGLDGLATGTSAIAGATLGILAYVSGNLVYADYLNIMYIPHSGELVIFIAAFIGATIGFLWYNSFPAQVFMGDTGSLSLGGIIAVFAIIIHKELLIPLLCGIFLMENLSVVMQVSYFKYTKRKYGEGRRIFLMSPLHHHFQKKGIPEPKIVTRFWIVGIALAVLTIVTLKIR